LKYDGANGLTEGLASVQMSGKWGFIDINENVVIPFMYDDVEPFINGSAEVILDGGWYLIDKENHDAWDMQ
jgi:hypothetical protein